MRQQSELMYATAPAIRDGRKPLQAELYERRCVTAAMSGAQTGIEQALADRSVRHASSAGIQLSAP